MTVYRIANSLYKDDLSGQGASMFGGRWNSKGNPILYSAEHISLAVLELLVNFNKVESPFLPSFHLLEIELPDSKPIVLKTNELKKDWKQDMHYSQFIGDEFLKDNTKLILKVPSVVIPEEFNLLINPAHKDFKNIKIIRSKVYHLDDRLMG